MSEQGTAVQAAPKADPPARKKGPPVFLDMDQQELDDNYDQIKYAPNQPQIVARYTSASAAARTRLGEPRRLAYGQAAVEGFDLYAAPQPDAPIFVFIHGGAWRRGEARDYSFPAEMVLGAGAHFIALDFDNVVTTKGDLMPMADQVRRAVAWIFANASHFGGDPRRLYVCGHSSGGHLAGVVLDVPKLRSEIAFQFDVLRDEAADHAAGFRKDEVAIENLRRQHLLAAEGEQLAGEGRGTLCRRRWVLGRSTGPPARCRTGAGRADRAAVVGDHGWRMGPGSGTANL